MYFKLTHYRHHLLEYHTDPEFVKALESQSIAELSQWFDKKVYLR
jgi:hypothetical protein